MSADRNAVHQLQLACRRACRSERLTEADRVDVMHAMSRVLSEFGLPHLSVDVDKAAETEFARCGDGVVCNHECEEGCRRKEQSASNGRPWR